MFKLLKKFFSILAKNKKTVFLIWFLVLVIFVIRFPWNDLLEKSFRDFQKKSPTALKMKFDKLKMKLFPPGMEFQNLSFVYQNNPISLNSLIVSMDLAKWLAFKKAWKFKIFKGDSYLRLNFYKSTEESFEDSADDTPIEAYFIKGFAPFFDLRDLKSFTSKTELSGNIKLQFFYNGSPQDVENIKASLQASGKDIYLSKLELQTPLGPLNLPTIEWSSISIDIEVKESELLFKTLRLGESKDDFNMQIRGSGGLAFSSRFQPILNSYNLELQIDLSKQLPIKILDLMFSSYKEDKGSFYRYSVRLMGQGSQVPRMEKLESF
ncbi:MAG: hypothetical protein OXC37_02475 [Bdellovibrionaceae bacterium]|nr:hypothetical protein [Pseudobdellovibrionaceae bacterium]